MLARSCINIQRKFQLTRESRTGARGSRCGRKNRSLQSLARGLMLICAAVGPACCGDAPCERGMRPSIVAHNECGICTDAQCDGEHGHTQRNGEHRPAVVLCNEHAGGADSLGEPGSGRLEAENWVQVADRQEGQAFTSRWVDNVAVVWTRPVSSLQQLAVSVNLQDYILSLHFFFTQ